jgi:hypothetical protein
MIQWKAQNGKFAIIFLNLLLNSCRWILFTHSRWFFVFGFEKNTRSTISDRELETLQEIASDLLKLTPAQLNSAVADKTLEEICDDSQS